MAVIVTRVDRARSEAEIDTVRALVWEFFDRLRDRYPDMLGTIDNYIKIQDVAGQLANFRSVFLPPAGECFIAFADDEIVGMVMLRPHGRERCELNRMYVRESARGLGLGRQLCQALVDEARRLGFREIFLDALYRHVEALPLYRSIGFSDYSDPDVFDAGDARVVHMRMYLRDANDGGTVADG